MNHFMLPEGDMQSPASATMRYGAFAMEVLINELLKAALRATAWKPRCSAAARCCPPCSR